MVKMVPVKSSNIKSVGYDEDARELSVAFHSGNTFIYESVPPELGHIAHTQESVGKFVHGRIRGLYHGRKHGEPRK